MDLGLFRDHVRSFAQDLYNSFEGTVRLISHLDADGLSSAGILISLLRKLNVPFHLTIVKYVSESLVEGLREEPYEVYLFSDLGSGDLEVLSSLGRRVFIVDHHRPEGDVGEIRILNPFLAGLDGDREISGAGVAFLLYYEMLDDPDMAPMAITGALGDVQEDDGFRGLNREILKLAEESGLVEVRPDLRLFGGPDYPLVASLERTVDPFIEGVSNNSAGALALVESLGIPIKVGERWTTLSDLTEEQKRDLTNELVKRMESLEKAKSLVGNVYIYLKEPKGSPLRDLSSFATILNACGRMGGGHIGALLASGLRGEILNRALELQQSYKRVLAQVLRSARPRIVGRVAFIDEGLAEDTMIGTVTSILSKSLRDADIVVGYANTEEGMIKVSARVTGRGSSKQIDLDELLRTASKEAGGTGGGHQMAAGAQIPKERKKVFESTLLNYFD